jgi:hypothetical protein
MRVPDLLSMVPVRWWLDIAYLRSLSLTMVWTWYASTTLCTCHTSFCHRKNYYVVPLLFWVLVFCCTKD